MLILNSFYHKRYCLTKAQEEIIKARLPTPKTTGRPGLNPLIVFNAIFWIMSSGAAWRDLPPRNFNSIYHKEFGAPMTFSRISWLVSDTEKYLLVEMDSTFCFRASYQDSQKIRQAIGVSRDGKTVWATKLFVRRVLAILFKHKALYTRQNAFVHHTRTRKKYGKQ